MDRRMDWFGIFLLISFWFLLILRSLCPSCLMISKMSFNFAGCWFDYSLPAQYKRSQDSVAALTPLPRLPCTGLGYQSWKQSWGPLGQVFTVFLADPMFFLRHLSSATMHREMWWDIPRWGWGIVLSRIDPVWCFFHLVIPCSQTWEVYSMPTLTWGGI